MKIKVKQLTSMLNQAYCAGQGNSSELREELIDEILYENKITQGRDLRVYSTIELNEYPVGSKFYHSLLGEGEIVRKEGVRQLMMKFSSGVVHSISTDAFPWNLPMSYMGFKDFG